TYSTSPPVLWGVSKVADRSGNSATFHYDTDTVQRRFRPAYVQYTHSTTAGAGRYKVVFVYQSSARPDIAERTIASAPGDVRIREDRLLDRIELKHDDVVYRQYRLTYETGAGANSRLKTVTECAATTAECFPASTLAWQSATSGHAAPSTLTIAGVPIPMDANGDGAEDLVYPSAGTWRLRLGGAAGYGTEINTGLAATNTSKAMALRWNDDDRMDLLVDWSDGKWRVLRGAQNGFESTVVHAGPGAGIASNTASSAWMVADMNGDGKDDLLRAVTTGTSKIYARLNTSTGFAAETLALSNLYYKFPSSPFGSQTDVGASAIRRADFNGDGMTDLTVYACEWDYESSLCMVTQWQMLLSTGAGYQFFWNLPGSTYGVQPRYADFNGDGLTDLAYPSQSPAQWCFGYGQSAGGLYLGCGASTAGYVTFPLIAADYDSDGYDDLYVSRSGTNVWEVLRSTGSAMATTATTTGISSAGGVWISSDFSGDGLDDLARSGGANLAHLGVPGELLSGATDGFGNAVSFTYLPMSNATVYTRGTGAAPPQADFQGSSPLVRSVQVSPVGGTAYTLQYAYSEGRIDFQGRGFLGMKSRVMTDLRDNVTTTEIYRQDFPYIGALESAASRQPGSGLLIDSVSHTYDKHVLDSTSNNQRYLPYRPTSVMQRYEIGGVKNGTLISQTTESRTVNTLGNTTTASAVIVDYDSGSPDYYASYTQNVATSFSADQTNWCLSLPVSRTETRTQPGGASEARAASWVVSGTQCRVTQQTIEPGAGSTVSLVTDLGYDACGNVNSVSTYPAGQSSSARTTSLNFGSRCQLPETETNPLGQASTIAHDYALGVPTSRTDPNGLAVSYQYDGFGRLVREAQPDGTAVRTALIACNAGNGYCGKGSALALKVTRTARDTSDAVLRTDEDFFDGVGRVRFAHRDTLESGAAMIEQQYDAFGRITQRSQPRFAAGATYWSSLSYDLLGRVTQENAPVSAAQPSGRIRTIAYEGRDTRTTDPRGYATTRVTDVLGRLRKVIDPSPGGTTLYTYRPFGEPAAVTDAAGNVTSWSYNLRGFVTATSDPDAGNWSYVPNAFGELASQTDAKSQSLSFTYDKLGRPLTRVEPEGTTTWIWGTSATAKNLGRLASISSPGGYAESYVYDSLGRPAQQQVTVDGTAHTINQTYSASSGWPATLEYPLSTSGYR
ncbi:MAG: hypothetical protein KBE42_14070, partial [Steroidobacteraceae bacterium]|nr:hypothetical protein [Steroidobacteraceae bacterium]